MIGWVAVAGIALAAWVWLVLVRGFFWRTDQRLPVGAALAEWPEVAIVVPARDEADVLPSSLPSLLAQRYPGPARVILVDDNSSDGTAELARRLGQDSLLPLTVTSPGQPPEGWTGKLWAVAHGVSVAGPVEYLLVTDADIAHEPDSLAALAGAAGERDLVSLMATLRVETLWERLIVPAFVYFFALLFPFRWVNRPDSRTAAAAGGCVLIRRSSLENAGGYAAIAGAVIDDVALAGLLKRAGGRIWLGLADRVRSVRPYPGLADLWRMVARSAYTQLRHSLILLTGTVAGLLLVFVAPPVTAILGAATENWLVGGLGAAAWLLMAGSFAPMLRHYRLPVATALVLPVTAVLYLAMTVDSARRHLLGRGAAWKGRTYSTVRG